ncbi:thioesterase domain-containing protein [Millisia brevis]|uniref:thioesterase domain-containing protein n=1 Tax=Millisia brevis TaxID=264148 RepID=UPI00082AA80F|nr:thioesterase domain-containing protein [Millisia brevis]
MSIEADVAPESASHTLDEPFELTVPQRGIWLAQHLAPMIPMASAYRLDISGPLSVDVFARATARTASEFALPLTRLVVRSGGAHPGVPRQKLDAAPSAPQPIDVSGREDPGAAALEWMRRELAAPIDINRERLVRHALIRLDDHRHIWFVRVHRVAHDGGSMAAMLARVCAHYNAELIGRVAEPMAARDPRSSLDSDRRYRDSPRFAADREYWHGLVSRLRLPIGPAAAVAPPSPANVITGTDLPIPVASRIASVAMYAQVGVETVLTTAFCAYLAGRTRRDDVVFGLALPTSPRRGCRWPTGPAADPLPTEVRCDRDVRLDHLVARTLAAMRRTARHRLFPASEIPAASANAIGHIGTFGPTVNLVSVPAEVRLGEAIGRIEPMCTGPTTDLTLTVLMPGPGRAPQLYFEGNPALYTADELAADLADYVAHLDQFSLASGATSLGDLVDRARAPEPGPDARVIPLHRLVLPPDVGTILPTVEPSDPADPNEADPDRPAPEDVESYGYPAPPRMAASLPDLLAIGVALAPDVAAVVDGDRELTYRDLDVWSNRLARVLISEGVGPETIVATHVPLSLESVLATWAVAKTGASFAPIDPELPATDRTDRLRRSGASMGITLDAVLPTVRGTIHWIVMTSEDLVDTIGYFDGSPISESERSARLLPDNPVFTATTDDEAATGLTLTQQGIGVLARALGGVHRIGVGSRLLHRTRRGSLEAAVEVAAACAGGATLVIAPTGRGAASRGPVAPDGIVIDRAMILQVSRPDAAGPYLLDRHLAPVLGPGTRGEHYLPDPGLRGFRGNPALTAVRMVADPYGPPGSRMYRTDAHRRPEGAPVRYLRLAPEPPSETSPAPPSVDDTPGSAASSPADPVDTTAPGEPDQRSTPDGDPSPTDEAEAVPMTETGTHHRITPTLDTEDAGEPLVVSFAPDTDTDEVTAEHATVSSATTAGTGGSAPSGTGPSAAAGTSGGGLSGGGLSGGGPAGSGLAGSATAGAAVSSTSVSSSTTVSSTTAAPAEPRSTGRHTAEAPRPLAPVITLSSPEGPGLRPPLFVIHPTGGLVGRYRRIAELVDPALPIHGVQARGIEWPAPEPASIGEIARDYINTIRPLAPTGPFRLLGFSVGGVIAHAMAVELQKLGETVDLMVIDAYPRPEVAAPIELMPLLAESIDLQTDGVVTAASAATILTSELDDPSITIDHVTRMVERGRLLERLAAEHDPGRYVGDLLFFSPVAISDDEDEDDDFEPKPWKWRRHVRGAITDVPIETRGALMHDADALEVIAARLDVHLRHSES